MRACQRTVPFESRSRGLKSLGARSSFVCHSRAFLMFVANSLKGAYANHWAIFSTKVNESMTCDILRPFTRSKLSHSDESPLWFVFKFSLLRRFNIKQVDVARFAMCLQGDKMFVWARPNWNVHFQPWSRWFGVSYDQNYILLAYCGWHICCRWRRI